VFITAGGKKIRGKKGEGEILTSVDWSKSGGRRAKKNRRRSSSGAWGGGESSNRTSKKNARETATGQARNRINYGGKSEGDPVSEKRKKTRFGNQQRPVCRLERCLAPLVGGGNKKKRDTMAAFLVSTLGWYK